MTAPVVPTRLVCGDTWSFTYSHGDYPAGTWSATLFLENAAATYTANSVASGSDHAITIDATTTAAFKSGRYRWSIRLTDGSTVTTADSGWTDALTNPAAAGTSDPRSDARKMLDALNAFLVGKASSAQQSMSLNGRAMATYTLTELLEWQQTLEAKVRTEEGGGASWRGRTLKLRFNRA